MHLTAVYLTNVGSVTSLSSMPAMKVRGKLNNPLLSETSLGLNRGLTHVMVDNSVAMCTLCKALSRSKSTAIAREEKHLSYYET